MIENFTSYFENEEENSDKWNWVCFRWLVRVFDSIETTKEGWVPASILDADPGQRQTEKAIYGDRVDDAAYRRQYEPIFYLI